MGSENSDVRSCVCVDWWGRVIGGGCSEGLSGGFKGVVWILWRVVLDVEDGEEEENERFDWWWVEGEVGRELCMEGGRWMCGG